jgi:6-phosphogluconolactonase
VFRIEAGRRIKVQSVPSQRPSFLALDSARSFLFAVNEISNYQNLPAGSVESYAVHSGAGYLSLVSRQSLSMSAIMPRHLAVAPDGRHLVVAVYGGGAYNVLPILKGGELGPVSQTIKEVGSSIHPERQTAAHPHSVVFHPSGKFLLGTDLGADRINVFTFRGGRLSRAYALAVAAGSGPAHMEIDPAGSCLHVVHELHSSISSYRFDPDTGRLARFAGRPLISIG